MDDKNTYPPRSMCNENISYLVFHLRRMTSENLHSKVAIAHELAIRDAKIDALLHAIKKRMLKADQDYAKDLLKQIDEECTYKETGGV